MKINYMKLNNIGPYYGTHVFDLNTSSLKNVILIGGKNGAGKTTFLKAMKYGLFGCFSMGFKSENATYLKEIQSILNNKAKDDFSIEINFEYVENYIPKQYLLKRFWKMTDGFIDEFLQISIDGQVLDMAETKEIMDKLRAITSPNLINSFIYDGEKISGIIENGDISFYLKELFNSIFNIDLLNQTVKDLTNYLGKKSEENNSKSQIETVALLNKINSYKGQLKSIEIDLNNARAAKVNLLTLRKSASDKFYSLGGLDRNTQKTVIQRMDKIAKQREEMNRKLREYIEDDLPLYLNLSMLDDAKMQAILEKRAKYPKLIYELEDLLNEDLSLIREKLMNFVVDCPVIHNLTDEETEAIGKKMFSLMVASQDAGKILRKRTYSLDEYKVMKDRIAINENLEVLTEILEEIKKIDISLMELEKQIDDFNSTYSMIKSEFDFSYQIYVKLTEDIKKNSLYDSSFKAGNNCIKICEIYSQKLTKKKLKQVSSLALQIFDETIRKNDFITKLEITNDFELILFNNSIQIDPKILSAGEMQILVSSLIWAMFRISGRREMFIFDTPLARLDTDNRISFINNIVSTISSQVVILSTDSEFVGENYTAVEQSVCRKYLLKYDEKMLTSEVVDGYFGGEQL